MGAFPSCPVKDSPCPYHQPGNPAICLKGLYRTAVCPWVGLRPIAGGSPPVWDLPLPEPFWFRWLPETNQEEFIDSWETYGPPFLDAFKNLVILALAWEAPAVLSFFAVLNEWWEANIGGTPPSPYPSLTTIAPIERTGYYALPDGAANPPTDASTSPAIYNPETDIRDTSYGVLGQAVGQIQYHLAKMGPLTFAGAALASVAGTISIADSEAELVVGMDFATVEITSAPSGLGGLWFDGARAVVPRLGWLQFGLDGFWDERQKIENLSGIYRPRCLARADRVRLKVKTDVEGSVTGLVGWLVV
jgi:hypothetical protein